MIDTAIFVDENVDSKVLSEIKNLNGTIISFDIHSHHILADLEIPHENIENYLSKEKNQMIDDLGLKLAKNWYNQKEFSNVLDYDGFNLGTIIETPFHLYLIQKLKKILGLKEILEIEKPKTIFSNTSFFPIIDFFDKKETITKNKLSLQKNHDEDKVILPLIIGSKSYNIWISKNFALKIAKFIESLSNIFFNLKLDIKKVEKESSILLLDLNPKPYEILLHELSKLSKNIILIKDFGPITWNKENIKIIKKSKSKIFGLEDIKNKKLDFTIKKKQQDFIQELEKIFSHEYDYFSIDGISMWQLIKKDFFEICNQNFTEAIKIFELSRQLFKKIQITNILTLYNANVFQQIFLYVAQENNISCIRLQHGLDPLNEYLKKFLPSWLPKHQTKLIHGLWGKRVQDYLLSSNVIQKNQSIILGNPRYDKLLSIKKQCKNTNSIILASSYTYTGFDLSGFDSNISKHHKEMFKESCKIINNLKDKKLLIKFHPGVKTSYPVQSILNEINPDIPVFKTQNIFELLKNCELLVCLDYSTILLEALILGKPTIIFMTNPQWYKNDELISSGSTLTVSSPSDFERALKLVLYDKNYREKLITNGNKFVEKYMSNLGTSSKHLAKILEKSQD